jgi:demethylmenaquinone methyltransferase/2-methoxy-6-polyprenyl-1,4-benzoquinol methylase
VKERGWSNVSLVRADALEFQFPAEVDAIVSTFALSLVPEGAEVIAHGCGALSPGGRWAVLDSKRPFAVTEELLATRPWEAIRAEMRDRLTDFSCNELFLGFAYLAAGARDQLRTPVPRQDCAPRV